MRTALGGIGIAALVVATLVPTMARSPSSYIVGAKTFAEQYVLSALVAQRLRAAGLSASIREGLGSNVIFDALVTGDIDVYVDYSGTLVGQSVSSQRHQTARRIARRIEDDPGAAESHAAGRTWFCQRLCAGDADASAPKRSAFTPSPISPRMRGTMSMAADYEFFSRPEWAGLQKAYGLTFRAQRQMQPDFMYAAVASGEVDVIAGYTSDGLIAKYDLVVLDDPPARDPALRRDRAAGAETRRRSGVARALQPLLGRIDIAAMREANLRAAGNDGASSPDAVARWLWEKIGTTYERTGGWRWIELWIDAAACYRRSVLTNKTSSKN